jgi:hypothetical protein
MDARELIRNRQHERCILQKQFENTVNLYHLTLLAKVECVSGIEFSVEMTAGKVIQT